MKKILRAVIIAAACAATATLAGCSSKPSSVFALNTGVKLPEYESVTTVDTRGGFHGDGELNYEFYLSEENGATFETRVQSAKHWQALPMTATLDRLVYEHFKSNIPRIENGYYYFYDEQHKTHEDTRVEGSFSYDFVVGIYDKQTSTVYYYEQHT